MYKIKKINKSFKKMLFVSVQAIFIATICIFIASPISCNVSPEGIDFIGGDYVSPKLESYKVIDGSHIKLNFSEDVNVFGVSVSSNEESNKIAVSSIEKNPQEKSVILQFDKKSVIGKSYILGGIVEDEVGNSLTFSLPFSGYNEHIPKVLITEFQSEHKTITDKNITHCEYVELMALEDGNLFGLVIGSVGTKEENDYVFPPIDVKKGELIVVHLRNQGKGCISEEGDDLNLATSPNSAANVRDLWSDFSGSALSNNADVIYIRDIINNVYIEGVAYNDPNKTEWSEKNKEMAEKLFNDGVISSQLVGDAINIKEMTQLQSLNRIEASEIRDKILKGEDISPIEKYKKGSWQKMECNAGRL